MSEFISPDDTTYDERARGLVRIGREAIAVANDEKLDAYFAPEFSFHGPNGDSDYPQLKAYFAAMRAAFDDFACERRMIISDGDYIGAATTMSGVFNSGFEASPVGPLEPTGRPMRLDLQNIFRYAPDGRLVEEWVQYDNLGFLRQLGVDLTTGQKEKGQ